MASTLLVFEVLLGTLRRPAFWWIVAMMWFGWLGLEAFMPLGLVTDGLHRSAAHYEVALVGACLAMLLATGPLVRLHHVLRPTGALQRTLLELASLACVGTLTAACVLVPAHFLQTWQFPDFHAERSILAFAAGALHFAAVCVLVRLRWPQRLGARTDWTAPLPALLAFGVPALLTGSSPPGLFLLRLLDVGAPLRISFDSPLNGALWFTAALPTVALGAIAAFLLAPGRTARP